MGSGRRQNEHKQLHAAGELMELWKEIGNLMSWIQSPFCGVCFCER